MNIGKKIKELRKKNDLTQEKLADLLGISYQSVSKWECGITMPDLSMIPALTKLLHVSSDELLDLKNEKENERRMHFDCLQARCGEDDIEIYARNAEDAIREFPGDMKYLAWYASCLQMLGAAEKDETKRRAIYERAVSICDTVIESDASQEVRNSALSTAVYSLVDSDCRKEARYYAEQYPENSGTTREQLIGITLTGEERAVYDQEVLLRKVECLLSALSNMNPADERVPILCDAVGKIIKVCFPDGNYLYQYDYLFMSEITLACHFTYKGEKEKCLSALYNAQKYAQEFDKIFIESPCEYRYSSPLFPLVKITEDDCRLFAAHSRKDSFKWWLSAVWFDGIRDTAEFQGLIQ